MQKQGKDPKQINLPAPLPPPPEPEKKAFKDTTRGTIVINVTTFVVGSLLLALIYLTVSWVRDRYWKDPRLLRHETIIKDHHLRLFKLECLEDEMTLDTTGKYCYEAGKIGRSYEDPYFGPNSRSLPKPLD